MSESEDLGARLVERVLLPLLIGGEIQPLAPIGARRAVEIDPPEAVLQSDAYLQVEQARLRVARELGPFDGLSAVDNGQWLLLCALNDLLQVTDPFLTGVFGGARPGRLLDMCAATIQRAGPPATVGDALARHATLSRAVEIVRVDTHVAWWVGSRDFHGVRPPGRLLAWRRVRRVRTSEQKVTLVEMADPAQAWASRWQSVARQWLSCSPLSALAGAVTLGPMFEWSGSLLGLIACAPGHRLAHRAVARSSGWLSAATRAARALPDGGAREAALRFCAEVESRQQIRRSQTGSEASGQVSAFEAFGASVSEAGARVAASADPPPGRG